MPAVLCSAFSFSYFFSSTVSSTSRSNISLQGKTTNPNVCPQLMCWQRWTEGAFLSVSIVGFEFDAQVVSRAAQLRFLGFYLSIVLAAVLATTVRSEFSVTGGARAARKVFEAMIRSVMFAPMSYFESTPLGRLLNRFSYGTSRNLSAIKSHVRSRH